MDPQTVVSANCTECDRDVTVLAGAVTATVTSGDGGTYTFTCPKCGEVSTREFGRDVYQLFKLAIGIHWAFPPAEISERPTGPMLTHDDLILFAVALWSASDAEILARAVL